MNIINFINERKILLNEIIFTIKNNTKLNHEKLFAYNLLNSYRLNKNKIIHIYEVQVTTKGLLYFVATEDQLIFSDNLSLEELNDFYKHLSKDIEYRRQEIRKFNTNNISIF